MSALDAQLSGLICWTRCTWRAGTRSACTQSEGALPGFDTDIIVTAANALKKIRKTSERPTELTGPVFGDPDLAARHAGQTCTYIDALGPAEASGKGPGLYFMDTSSAAAECVTLMAAAGYVIHTFPTGQGNVVGNPILPVIKISGNPRTFRTMSEHIDVDVTGVLTREQTIEEAGDRLIDMIERVANGRMTAAEALGHREISMTKLYRSA